MRVLGCLLVLALAGCGGTMVTVGDADGGPGSPSPSSGDPSRSDGGGDPRPSSDGGRCRDGEQGAYCPWGGCLDGPRATCSQGAWSCPTPPPACNEQCTAMPKPACKCAAACVLGSWRCSGCPAVDAGGPVTCGTLTCQSTELCTDTPPGVVMTDGGTTPDYFACAAIPQACIANPTCDCIKANPPPGCPLASCSVIQGQLQVVCVGF